jgi:hypothetical protein
MLLTLLFPMLLGEVRDTVPDAMRTVCGRALLAVLDLFLHLLTGRAGGSLPLAVLLRLAVLLTLLFPMLLGEVRDTVPNPMCIVGQRILTTLHLGLNLLAERPRSSGCRRPGAEGADRDDRHEDRDGHFAFDRCRNCGC